MKDDRFCGTSKSTRDTRLDTSPPKSSGFELLKGLTQEAAQAIKELKSFKSKIGVIARLQGDQNTYSWASN